jgi:hypothetical protein
MKTALLLDINDVEESLLSQPTHKSQLYAYNILPKSGRTMLFDMAKSAAGSQTVRFRSASALPPDSGQRFNGRIGRFSDRHSKITKDKLPIF